MSDTEIDDVIAWSDWFAFNVQSFKNFDKKTRPKSSSTKLDILLKSDENQWKRLKLFPRKLDLFCDTNWN